MADFREAAAAASQAILGGDGEKSLCMPAGSKWVHYCIELPFTALSLVCMIFGIGTVPMSFLGWIPGPYVMPLLVTSLTLSMCQRTLQSSVVRLAMSMRREGFPRVFKDLPRVAVAIEDGETAKTVKLITEDLGVCLLDAGRRRLLIEGIQYQYILYGRDITSIKPISGYGVSAASVTCAIAGQPLELVIANAGLGPIASLIHAFNSSIAASAFAVRLNKTLFDDESEVYVRRLPPPVPGFR